MGFAKDMKRDKIDSAEDMVTLEAIKNSTTNVIQAGSLLFVTRSGILKHSLPVASNTAPVAINQDIKALTFHPGLDADFFRYQVRANTAEILSATVKSGTTVESIDFAELKKIQILAPPAAEQRRIARRLDGLFLRTSVLRGTLDNLLLLLESYRRSIFTSAFNGTLTKKWRVDRAISDEWHRSSLSEISEIQTGVTLGKVRPSGIKLLTVPYLRVANVQRGWLDLSEVKKTQMSQAEADRLYLQPGDILMNEGGDRDKLGRGWIWEGQIARCVHQNHVFRVRLRDKKFPPKFISLFANEFGKEHFFSHGKQTTNLASISKSRLASLPIPLPSAAEAVEVVRQIESACALIDRVRDQCNTSILQIDKLNQSLLAKAFRGELDPGDPSDDPIGNILYLGREKLPQVKPNRRPARAKGAVAFGRKGSMAELDLQFKDWPKNGLTFEELHQLVVGDYERLKETVFQLLSAPNPVLKQQFDQRGRVMRLVRVER